MFDVHTQRRKPENKKYLKHKWKDGFRTERRRRFGNKQTRRYTHKNENFKNNNLFFRGRSIHSAPSSASSRNTLKATLTQQQLAPSLQHDTLWCAVFAFTLCHTCSTYSVFYITAIIISYSEQTSALEQFIKAP